LTRLTLLLAVLLLIGCQSADPQPSGSPVSSAVTSPVSTAPPSPSPTATTTPTPVTADGDCFYLDTGFVEQTVGQRIARTTYTTTSHESLPGCTFYRSDGEPAADVAITTYDSAVQAQIAAVDVGTAAANPIDDIADGGVVTVSVERTVLAVTSGSTLLVVTINQASSLEARAIAAEVAPLLG